MLSHLQRGTIIVFVAAVVAAASSTTAQGSALRHRPMEHCGKRQAAKTELHCARHALHANASEARWIRNHRSRTLQAASWAASHEWRSRLKFLRWRVRVDRRLIGEARRRLAPRPTFVSGYGGTGWDRVAACESGGNWSLVTGNGFYWGLQWVPSTWDSRAHALGLPTWAWFIDHHTAPSRAMQIRAATGMSLSNWPVCGARY